MPVRSLVWVLLVAVMAGAGDAAGAAELNPVRTQPRAAPPVAAHFIVKLRAGAAAARPGAAASREPHERVVAVAARSGLELLGHRPITGLMHSVQVSVAAAEAPAATLARLRADPDVEYAVPDGRRYVHSVPNDPLYSLQQWYLQSAVATPSAIDAQDAWSTTTGSTTLVIADVDTGVRPDHPDLASRLLPGYCFISDAFVANGGGCPGADATDPGDWITATDVTGHPNECSQETAQPSTWHGTRVAGILGAATNNSLGIGGITWGAPILPVRALGKCGGADSDIIAGMLWAGGITVSGAPNNPNPAKIINLSLGGTGSCLASYQDAVDQLTALGVLVVASAGNEGGPVDAPANCSGVAAVAGLRQAGTKVGYSSLGPEVALGAPAGNCGNGFTTAESQCVYSITTATNLGATTPVAYGASGDYTGHYYCDSTTGSYPGCSISAGQYRDYNIGTSFSAPVVTGIAVLMSTLNSSLNSCQLIARLKEGSQSYPQTSLDATGSQPPLCHVPVSATDVQASECICTRDGRTCGAGMANAPRALAAALRPIAAVALPASVSAGQSVALDGRGSGAADGHTIAGYQWSPVGGAGLTLSITGGTTSRATLTAPSCGVGTVALTVTDNSGRADTANVVITPTSASSIAPASAGQSACSAVAPAIVVAVCPAAANVPAGSGTATFAATLANTTDPAVTWEVNGLPDGDATVGTITSSGIYSAPASVPSPATVTVSAVSAADPNQMASAQVTITAPAGGSGGGGGAIDWMTLLGGAAALTRAARRRRPRPPAPRSA
jgi:serine protease